MLQDIDVGTKKQKQIRIELKSERGAFFISLQEFIRDGSYAGMHAVLASPLHKFGDAKTAFEYAVKAVRLFLSYSGDDICTLNNPCNCEFISAENQRIIISSFGLDITPTVNE